MDQSSSESQQYGLNRERNNRTPPPNLFSTQQKSPRERPSQFFSSQQPSPINIPSQMLSKAQLQTPIQGRGIQEQGSRSRNSMIQQRFQSNESEMEEELVDYAEDYNLKLEMIFVQLNNLPNGAIALIDQLIEEYDQDKLRQIDQQGNLDKELVRLISHVVERLDNSLTSNTIRILLSQARNEWKIQQINTISQRVLEDLTIERPEYALYLLTQSTEQSDLWKKALQNQQFESLPENLLKYLIDETQFDFLMECLLFHQSAAYDQQISDRIWNTLIQVEVYEKDKYYMLQNVEWMLELCGKSQAYLRDFLSKGFLHRLLFFFIRFLQDSIEYLELITQYLNQLLEFGLPNILSEILKTGLMSLFAEIIKDVQLTDAGYQILQSVHLNISIQYRDQLKASLPNSDWYQKILFKLLIQSVNERISQLAQKEIRKWILSEDRQHFATFLSTRYEYLNHDLQLKMEKIMQ